MIHEIYQQITSVMENVWIVSELTKGVEKYA